MAKMIDKIPEYEGEKKVWEAFSANLPQQYVVYNTRSIKGWEYDFCIMAEGVGLIIVEVKGWKTENVFNVIGEDMIILSGEDKPQSSPRKQARAYRFNMINLLKDELAINPLVMDLVCYPMISKKEYYDKRLDVVSDETETIFKEDLESSTLLYKKIMERYNINKSTSHDELSKKNFALIRHLFEPNYDLKEIEDDLNPGYSRLRAKCESLSEEEITNIVEEYFLGIKEIIFVCSQEDVVRLSNEVEKQLKERNLRAEKGSILVGTRIRDNVTVRNQYCIFNFEIYYVENIKEYISEQFLIEEGKYSENEKELLSKFSSNTDFNFQQYEIEHASTEKNIMVKAGAGTGKTYSMVSRIAFLCNRTTDAVVDIVKDIAMITFTRDAAENMKRRLKRMFMNYFILTSNEKYMHLIEDMSQIQISTIHKFAISLLHKECMRSGLGYDSQVTSETFERRKIYHINMNRFLKEKTDENEDFVHQLTVPSYELEKMLIDFADQLFNKSIDVKSINVNLLGDSIGSIPFFTELIENVIIPSEIQYSYDLKLNNLINLRESMITINKLVKNSEISEKGLDYRFLFIDEFQDTDDIQIETILELQKIFGENCKLFVVGDLKQSIYRFRGATLSAFDKIEREMHMWNTFSLNRNYRTDGRLLELFHKAFSQMGQMQLLPYSSEDFLLSRIEKECDYENLVKKIESYGKDKEQFFDDFFKEIEFQKDQIEKICSKKRLSNEEKTIAILVRYNYQIDSIVKEAEKRNVTIKVSEGGDLFRLTSTIDLYKLVMAITHPYNEVYLTNLIESSYTNLKLDYINLMGCDSVQKVAEIVQMLDQYFSLLIGKKWDELVRDFETRPVLVVLRDIYEASMPWKSYATSSDYQMEYRTNYECLLEKITQKYSRDYLTIKMIEDYLKINITNYQEESARHKEEESEEIKILCTTIHKSKGLEYGTVFLPYTANDISKIYHSGISVNVIDNNIIYSYGSGRGNMEYSDYNQVEMEILEQKKEEIRILYVALTRAIRNVVWIKDLDNTSQESWEDFMEVIG